MWRFIADLSAVMLTEWAEKKIKTVPHSVKSISIINTMETRTMLGTISEHLYPKLKNEPRTKFTGSYQRARIWSVFNRSYFSLLLSLWVLFKNRNTLRTIEAQIAQKLKNNEARPKFTGSYKKKRVHELFVIPLECLAYIDTVTSTPRWLKVSKDTFIANTWPETSKNYILVHYW